MENPFHAIVEIFQQRDSYLSNLCSMKPLKSCELTGRGAILLWLPHLANITTWLAFHTASSVQYSELII
jgi:hypothetical protein